MEQIDWTIVFPIATFFVGQLSMACTIGCFFLLFEATRKRK